MRTIFITIGILFCISITNAQKIKSISIATVDETIALPFTRYTPYHPGMEFGATLWEKELDNSTRKLNVNFGGYTHSKVENGIYLGAEYLYIKQLKNSIYFEIPFGLSYLHTFYPGELYVQNQETGEFEVVNQFGRPHALAKTGIGLSFNMFTKFQPFVRQELLIEAPFANGIPVFPHSFIKIGVNIKLDSNENN